MVCYIVCVNRAYSDKQSVGFFLCELCQKRYSKANELDTHFLSYEHQHAKRLLELRQLTRVQKSEEPSIMKELEIEEKGERGESSARGSFKKVFGPSKTSSTESSTVVEDSESRLVDPDSDTEVYDRYNPEFPTQ
jgi:hypothetical protein